MLVSDVDDGNIMEGCASEIMVDVKAEQHCQGKLLEVTEECNVTKRAPDHM